MTHTPTKVLAGGYGTAAVGRSPHMHEPALSASAVAVDARRLGFDESSAKFSSKFGAHG